MPARLRRPRHPFRWLAAALIAVVALAVAIPYAYIHVFEKAPAALAVSAPAAPAAATSSVDGTWTVAPGSQAGYRVGEVLAGQSTTAVGRTSAVTGQFTVGGDAVTRASFTVDLTKVKSEQSRRDAQFQGRIMDTAKYPNAVFVLTKPIPLGPLATATGTQTVQASGTLQLHGTTKPVTVTLTVVRSASGVQVSGQIPVLFADYGIANPSFAGFVTTQDHGVVELLLSLKQA